MVYIKGYFGDVVGVSARIRWMIGVLIILLVWAFILFEVIMQQIFL